MSLIPDHLQSQSGRADLPIKRHFRFEDLQSSLKCSASCSEAAALAGPGGEKEER